MDDLVDISVTIVYDGQTIQIVYDGKNVHIEQVEQVEQKA